MIQLSKEILYDLSITPLPEDRRKEMEEMVIKLDEVIDLDGSEAVDLKLYEYTYSERLWIIYVAAEMDYGELVTALEDYQLVSMIDMPFFKAMTPEQRRERFLYYLPDDSEPKGDETIYTPEDDIALQNLISDICRACKISPEDSDISEDIGTLLYINDDMIYLNMGIGVSEFSKLPLGYQFEISVIKWKIKE